MKFTQRMTRIAATLALVVGGWAALPASAAGAQEAGALAASCSGSLIRHQPIASYGFLDIYYSSSTGLNCARTVSTGSYWGQAKYMEITLHVCVTPACNTWLDGPAYNGQDWGTYQYYAGPVTVNGTGRCIYWWAQIKTVHVSGHGHCG